MWPNPRLQRTRQLTRFRRQLDLTLEELKTARNERPRGSQNCGLSGSSFLAEHAFRPALAETFRAAAVDQPVCPRPSAPPVITDRTALSASPNWRPLNRVNIPGLRLPLSRHPLGRRTHSRDSGSGA